MNEDVQHKLNALFATYRQSLPGKIETLREEWTALLKEWDKARLIDFHRNVHSLCGSAGTYGYTELGKAARALEVYLKSLLERPDPLSLNEQREIEQLLKYLELILTDCIAETPSPGPVKVAKKPQESLVYSLSNSDSLAEELKKNLEESDLKLLKITQAVSLKDMIEKKIPAAILIDLDSLREKETEFLTDFLSQFKRSIPLFCLARQGDILTRLRAIRLGSTDFYQKPLDPFLLAKKLIQITIGQPREPYRILIIDDSISVAEYYTLILKEAGMEARFITNPLALIESIEDFQPDLLLMDIYMPECTGLELAVLLRQEPQYTGIPIVFLSSEGDRVKQLSALNLGGDDFLLKPVEPQDLIHVLTSRAKRARVLGSLMVKDSFTGLYNHTNIIQRLENEVSRAQRNKRPLSFAMLDIDHFKLINDNFGHPVGDQVIRKIAILLQNSFRRSDIIGRYGGEEFAVVLPEVQQAHAIRICDNFRHQVSQLQFEADNHHFVVTLSVGIACCPPLKEVQPLINAADKALYIAKHNGRNQVVAFNESIDSL
ncbi:GGDEF domain-containing protein [Legionella taurinensis]|uniref:diguanylate cyclase n=1 Tax=Legionella taurinensis TaxID=70611 RepID=A0AB38N247_9GAMM|nr:diguanylate cyclase [Legionella taurinensis]MDX1838356.1 diguanylate cyclase [Legionella taurinensis]PUT39118.1 diguanylate cyclase response regulator [Legionella taurinensis]PUT39743.1 diguanylate cyclase response regulator [Legionella taurinensis]PUT43574.1 diguanylate cyclase response regulator [Legionella taurinensis]PUT45230.1 diguanylate cyclase response regulator [Legionella taurinensis]